MWDHLHLLTFIWRYSSINSSSMAHCGPAEVATIFCGASLRRLALLALFISQGLFQLPENQCLPTRRVMFQVPAFFPASNLLKQTKSFPQQGTKNSPAQHCLLKLYSTALWAKMDWLLSFDNLWFFLSNCWVCDCAWIFGTLSPSCQMIYVSSLRGQYIFHRV